MNRLAILAVAVAVAMTGCTCVVDTPSMCRKALDGVSDKNGTITRECYGKVDHAAWEAAQEAVRPYRNYPR